MVGPRLVTGVLIAVLVASWVVAFGPVGDAIAAPDPAGQITVYTSPSPGPTVRGIVGGPDGNVWVTEFEGNSVAKVTPDGTFTAYQLTTANSAPITRANARTAFGRSRGMLRFVASRLGVHEVPDVNTDHVWAYA